MAYDPNMNHENQVTVMSKSPYMAEPKASYSGDVLGMIMSVLLIIGGASGNWVLRGTSSSTALVVAGFLLLGWDIFSLIRKKSNIQKAEEEWYTRSSRMYDLENAVRKDDRKLAAPANITIVTEKGVVALDYGPRLNGNTLTRDVKTRTYSGSTSRVHNVLVFNNLDLEAVFDLPDDGRDVVISMFRDKTGLGIALPQGVTLIPEETDKSL